MSISFPTALVAGFHAERPFADFPELVHAGEQWAPPSFDIPEHSHDVWELFYQIDGTSRWEAEGVTFDLEPHSFFAAPPNLLHRMGGRPKAKHHFFFAAIDFDALHDRLPIAFPDWPRSQAVHLARADTIYSPFRRLIREVTADLPQASTGVYLALSSLVLEIHRIEARSRSGLGNLSLGDGDNAIRHSAVARVKAAMDAEPGGRWSLQEMSDRAGLSPAYFVERFTRDVGIAPHQYLMSIRIARAKELLGQTDLPITILALDLGFASSQHFAATFKRYTGKTAFQFRQRG